MFVTRAPVIAALLVILTSVGSASAKPPKAETKDEAAARVEQRAVQVYVGGDSTSAARSLEHALRTCEPPNGCSTKTRARLHVTLGTVRGAGQGDYAAAKKELSLALALDPDAKLSPALTNAQLTATFEEAKAESKPAPPPDRTSGPDKTTPEKPATPEKPPPDKPVSVSDLFHPDEHPPPKPPQATAPPPAALGPEPRRNWVSARLDADFSFLSDKNICSPGAPASYLCTDETGAGYTGRPQPNDDVSSGLAPSTARLLLGYERVLFAGLSAGALAGLALPFSGAPEGRSGMFPLHFEARGTYTFGTDPFLDDGPERFHPYAFLGLGLAQFDTKVAIRVYEIPCSVRAAPACKRDLDAHRRVGSLFTTLGGGVRFRLEGRHALRAGLRATLVFDETSFVFSPEVGYELGL
jgi:hypothetical protein